MFQMLVAGPYSSPGQGQSTVPTSNIGQCGEYNKKYSKLHEGLDSSISVEGKSRIERILNEIQLLTDVEKLLLYLKLPTGIAKDDYMRSSPPSCLPVSNRREQGEATTWIKSHLEEHGDVCMPKAEVYEEYKEYCSQHELRALCNADFGKVMKTVFPDINTRRLGQRGQSKYFYGGLRKKLEHSLPGLPELEIHSKTTEVDTNNAHTEVFKASCKLICEWADKLLDSKFTGVQDVAEHLVSSMYVNTKSVAAFTLIAAMQETGNQNLKGSALFNSQASSTADKHKETNFLLQQKLQKNKILQKQKEKLQTMKEENENGSPSVGKAGSIQSRTTPSKVSKPAKLQSPSPRHIQSPRNCPSNIPSTGHMVTMGTSTVDLPSVETSTHVDKDSINTTYTNISTHKNKVQQFLSDNDLTTAIESIKHQNVDIHERNLSQSEDITMLDNSVDPSVTDQEYVIAVNVSNDNPLSLAVQHTSISDLQSSRETPYTQMEGSSNTHSHVRRISFDDIGDPEQIKHLPKTGEQNKAKNKADGGKSAKIEMLSKSAGHLSLKMLLERKDENQSSLNKSTGLMEKSKNMLLVNQSNVAGRSAFVPFAQVQRREGCDSNQSAIVTNSLTEKSPYPIDLTDKVSQSSGITMVAQPDKHLQQQQLPDNIINIFPGSASLQLASGEKVSLSFPSSVTQTVSSTRNAIMDSLTILTSSTSVSTSSNSEMVVASSQNSPGLPKHLRTRFTPIRPKGSPNKATTSKDPKSDNPVYDKRPVSEILKEKRAKEQAEAIAKLQVGINLPTIPFQPSISLSSGKFGSFPQLQGVGGKEVVIIVNNQTRSHVGNLVTDPSMFQQPVMASKQGHSRDTAGITLQTGVTTNTTGREDHVTSKQPEYTHNSQVDSQAVSRVDSPQQYKDIQPASSSSEMEVDSYDLCNEADTIDDVSESVVGTDQEERDQFEQIYTETPAKIARLNITSPFRPDSACSLGRETPLRISKHQDPCSSRPDSASSYGRETPSGARKRKSSDYQRKDFKRLNSTGDECDDVCNERMLAELLSPGCEDTQRRTQSCTYELEREVRRAIPTKTQQANLPQGLQSPDITSLEEEALIESFPNSLFVMRPHKSQRHSVGVGARSVKMYQQRLLKQQQVLDQRVGTFLQQQKSAADEFKTTINDVQNIPADFKIPFKNRDVMKDSVVDVRHKTGMPAGVSGRGKKLENEPSGLPSGLPSDVADWINETIEKRQTLNHSVLSEPELGVLNPQRSSTAIDFTAPPFHFEVDQNRAKTCRSVGHPDKKTFPAIDTMKVSDDDTFTVPKAPTLSLKIKDTSVRVVKVQSPSERCQSLPMFTSTSKSPISPISNVSVYQRAVSMSPRQDGPTTGQTNLLSPVSGLTSPLRRIEVRDNHPISVHTPSTSKTREELKVTASKSNPIPMEEGRAGSYLASIQHNLQKPKDSSLELEHTKIKDASFIIPSSKFTGSKVYIAPVTLPFTAPASQTDIPDSSVKLAQFSDSGYQSSGPSPVSNLTAGIQEDELMQTRPAHIRPVSESPICITASIHQSTHTGQNAQSSFPHTDRSQFDGKTSQSVISSSKHSAFIPIQSSHQTLQFVTPTPIRPSVSLPNHMYQISTSTEHFSNPTSLFIDPNQSSISQDGPSPKGHDPPPYETAVKSLRQSNHTTDGRSSLDPTRLVGYSGTTDTDRSIVTRGNIDPGPDRDRVSLLANMGTDSRQRDSFGPFAAKLVQLSMQTKSSLSKKPSSSVKGFAGLPVSQATVGMMGSSHQPSSSVKGVPVSQATVGMMGSSHTVSKGNSAIQKDVIGGLVSTHVGQFRTQRGTMDTGDDGPVLGVVSDVCIKDGAKGVLSPNSGQHSPLNMDLDFLQSPDSHSLLHFASPAIEPVLYSSNPSFQTALNSVHSTYISHTDLPTLYIPHPTSPSGLVSSTPNHIQTRTRGHSTGHTSTGQASTGHASTGHESTGHASTGHDSTGHESTGHASTGQVREELTQFVARRHVDPVLHPRVDHVDEDLPVDLDLMLQDLKELESDLLQDGGGINLGTESQTIPDEINTMFHN